MKLKYFLLLAVLIFCEFISTSTKADEKKNILILNSYHKGLQWSDEIHKGFLDALDQIRQEKEIYIEYLDSKRFFYDDYQNELITFLKDKYQNLKFDIILLSDDFALQFLFENRDSLFGRVPVVFAGINNPHIYPSLYTGIIEDINFLDNLALIKKLHPDYSRIYFIADQTPTGNIVYDKASKLILSSEDKYRCEFVRDYTFDELFSKVEKLESNAVIFITAFTKDRKDTYSSYNNLILNLKKNTKVPIYGCWDFYLGRGIVGGKLNCGYTQGIKAGNIAGKILNGQNIENLDFQFSESVYKFDYNELKKKGIKKRNLPKNSIIINEPLTRFLENRKETIFIVLIIILLVVKVYIITSYAIIRKRKTKQEQEFKQNLELINEKLIKAKNKIEEAGRIKNAFMTNLSYEFKTPTSGIVSFVELLKDKQGIDDETRQKHFTLIQEYGHVLLNFVDNIIDLSKLESKNLQLNYKQFNLKDMMNELLTHFLSVQKKYKKEYLQLRLENDNIADDIFVFSDKDRVVQVMHNLLDNALKFTDKGFVEFGCYIESFRIVFYVKDSGIGLSEDEQKIIFDQFRKLEIKDKKYAGLGIGLALSKDIVENMKGKIWVESKKSKGSDFYFSIPYNLPETKKQVVQAEKQEYVWPSKTVLIVEDSFAAYQLLTKFLSKSKLEIIYAENGEQAVEICRDKSAIDLVLMDIQLPVMNGLDATRYI
ncbi:MAG: ATP-binding protein, partial [Bacteroidales bacterium]|nr:ATP-binding protein [Bacteroidales bacterium]